MIPKSPIIEIAKRVCPAVITVIASKDLPKAENFYSFPYKAKQEFIAESIVVYITGVPSV